MPEDLDVILAGRLAALRRTGDRTRVGLAGSSSIWCRFVAAERPAGRFERGGAIAAGGAACEL